MAGAMTGRGMDRGSGDGGRVLAECRRHGRAGDGAGVLGARCSVLGTGCRLTVIDLWSVTWDRGSGHGPGTSDRSGAVRVRAIAPL